MCSHLFFTCAFHGPPSGIQVSLTHSSQGMTVLGAPIGSAAFVQHQLQQANQQHQHLLDRIPQLEDLQASWLLLLHCASPRCTYLLRMCSPNVTAESANNHDFAVAACLRRLLAVDDLPAQALATAHLPLSQRHFGHHGQIHYQSSTPNLPSMQHKSWNTSNTLQRLSPAFKQQQRLQPKSLKSENGHPRTGQN